MYNMYYCCSWKYDGQSMRRSTHPTNPTIYFCLRMRVSNPEGLMLASSPACGKSRLRSWILLWFPSFATRVPSCSLWRRPISR